MTLREETCCKTWSKTLAWTKNLNLLVSSTALFHTLSKKVGANCLRRHRTSWERNLICKDSSKVNVFKYVRLWGSSRHSNYYLPKNSARYSYMSLLTKSNQAQAMMDRVEYLTKLKKSQSKRWLAVKRRRISA